MTSSDLTRRLLAKVFSQVKKPGMFLRDHFFNGEIVETTRTEISVDTINENREKAGYTRRNVEARIVGQGDFGNQVFVPPFINEKKPLTSEDLIEREAGQSADGTELDPDEESLKAILRKMNDLENRASRAIEGQCSDSMFLGQVTGEDGRIIDFGMQASHKVLLTGTDCWDNAGADIVGDLSDWMTQNADDSGTPSDSALMSQSAWLAALKNDKFVAMLDKRFINLGTVDPQYYIDRRAVFAAQLNLPSGVLNVYLYNDLYTVAGTSYRYVPDKKVWVGSANTRFDQYYAGIQVGSAMVKTQRLVDAFTKQDPDISQIRLRSAPLMVPLDIDSFTVATVLE